MVETFLGAPVRIVMVSQVHPGSQYHVPRLWTDTTALQWVEHYREKLRAAETLDPIIIDARFFIVDGHHRWRAHVLENKLTIKVAVSPTGGWPM
jgi:hypothetical protein